MTAHPRSSGCIVALALAVAALSACGSSASRGREGATCNDADKGVVSQIMDTARTDFKGGDSVTDHFDFVEAATAPIPESQQKHGAADLMVLLVSVYLQDADVPSDSKLSKGPSTSCSTRTASPSVPSARCHSVLRHPAAHRPGLDRVGRRRREIDVRIRTVQLRQPQQALTLDPDPLRVASGVRPASSPMW